MIVVIGFAADDSAERDDRGVVLTSGKALSHRRNLERAGHPDHVHGIVRDAVPLEALQGARDKLLHHVLIEARRHNGKATRRRGEGSLDTWHGSGLEGPAVDSGLSHPRHIYIFLKSSTQASVFSMASRAISLASFRVSPSVVTCSAGIWA